MASKAVIVHLLGGPTRGTRMRPITLTTPKPLFPIAGRAMIWHGIQALSRLEGLREVILIGFYEDSVFTQFIKDTSRDFPGLSIRYLREFQALGTAGGLYHFRDAILKGSPDQIFVLHADIACAYPLAELKAFHDRHRGVGTIMGVKVPRETASRYGCIVTQPDTKMAMHYVEKPESFISDIINGGIYLFDKSIFDEIRLAMDENLRRHAEEPLSGGDEVLRLEQDVIAPLASARRLYVFETLSFWRQIKTAGSAVPANALILSAYKTTNPTLLRRRAPTLASSAGPEELAKRGPELIEPVFVDETADIDPTAKIGPNVSIGAMTRIGYGARIRDAIILDNVVVEKNACCAQAIICDDCRIGPWARVEGSPADSATSKQNIAILGKEVTVAREVFIRSCIVLPHKSLSRSSANEVLL